MKHKKVTNIVYTIGRELVDQMTIQMILTTFYEYDNSIHIELPNYAKV